MPFPTPVNFVDFFVTKPQLTWSFSSLEFVFHNKRTMTAFSTVNTPLSDQHHLSCCLMVLVLSWQKISDFPATPKSLPLSSVTILHS